jgi:hypothetical protein
MSTQSYAPDRQAASQPTTSQKSTGPSWFQIWAAIIGTAALAGLVVLAVGLWHGQPSATPATTSTPTSTSAPAQPSANPAVPSRPNVNPAVPTGPSANPAVPSRPNVNPAVPSHPTVNPAVPAAPAGAQAPGASAR